MEKAKTATRSEYMSGKVSHHDYYLGIVDVLGRGNVERIVKQIVSSRTQLEIALAKDEHLNSIPLWLWDQRAPQVKRLVAANSNLVMPLSWDGTPLKPGTYCWSLGESVCVLKAAARRMANEWPKEESSS